MIDIKTHPIFKGTNPLKKHAHLARIYLAQKYAKMLTRDKFIGITGSVGKTSTVLACQAVLSQKFKTTSTLETDKKVPNLDMVFNLPMTILRVRPSTEKVVIEMGIEFPGEMDFYLSLVQPQTGIVTRIANAHSQFLGGVEDILKEKGKLIEQLPKEGFAILNYDDPLVRTLSTKTKAQVLSYGLTNEADVHASHIKVENFQLKFGINYGVERVDLKTKFLGRHMVYALLAAAALGISVGISLPKIKKALEAIEPADHRLKAFEGFNDSIILDDSYNAAPVAVEEAIETLSELPARRRIVVLGEMKELGEFSEKMHRQIAQKLYKEKPDLVFLGTGEANIIADELIKLGFIPERIDYNLKNSEIVNKLFKILAKGDVVLVKGAHSLRLDEVVDRLVKLK